MQKSAAISSGEAIIWWRIPPLRLVSDDQRLISNLNMFFTDWIDQQVSIPRPGGIGDNDRITANAGESEL